MTSRAVLLLVVAGCTHAAARDAPWERHASDLSGRWVIELDYRQSASAGVAHRSSRGTLTLTRNQAVSDPDDGAPLPTNYGTYDVDFSALGFNPSGGRVPAVFVRVEPGDTVVVSFETDRPLFSMWLEAPLAADSMRGTWQARQSRNVVASGTFIMSRR